MWPTLSPMTLDLAREQGVRLTDARGTRIACRSGALWITIDNDPRDVTLGAGESTTLDSCAGTLVQAILGPAEVAVTPPARDAARTHQPCKEATPWLQTLRAVLSWQPAAAR